MTMLLGPRTSPSAGIRGAVAILPVGACEAHGPHLPLDTDLRIAQDVAERAARMLGDAVVLPPLPYGVTRFARGFGGTLSIPGQLVVGIVSEVLTAAHAAGATGLAIANAHFEPAQVDALFAACKVVKERTGRVVAYPHFGSRRTSQRLASRVTGIDGHAGRFETSLALALAPELVLGHDALPAVEADLGAGILGGATSFEEAGGPDGYFGCPAEGSAEEGERLLEAMAGLLVEAIRDARQRA